MTALPEIILASTSPRRRELLAEAGLAFRVVAPRAEAECGMCSGESPPELVARLAYQKAADVRSRIERGLVVACDTVAECAGHVLGKPRDEEHAREFLQLLSGREHRVYSGLCLWQAPEGEPRVEVERTVLKMRPLSPAEIDEITNAETYYGDAPEQVDFVDGYIRRLRSTDDVHEDHAHPHFTVVRSGAVTAAVAA